MYKMEVSAWKKQSRLFPSGSRSFPGRGERITTDRVAFRKWQSKQSERELRPEEVKAGRAPFGMNSGEKRMFAFPFPQ